MSTRTMCRQLVAVLGAAVLATGIAGCSDTSESAQPHCTGKQQQTPGTTQASVEVQGTKRSYTVVVPTGYNASTPIPMVMAFHGRGMNGPLMLTLTGFDQVANENTFMVVAPSGQNEDWNLRDVANADSSDIAFVEAMLDQLDNTYCLDNARRYAAGMSAGSAFTFALACMPNRQFAAFGGVSASFYRPVCDRSAPAPLIYFHGTADDVVPYKGGKVNSVGADGLRSTVEPVATTMSDWAKHNKCTVGPSTTTDKDVVESQWSNCADSADIDAYSVTGGGHTWPGASDIVAQAIAGRLGKTTETVNASELMWQFFSGYTRPVRADENR